MGGRKKGERKKGRREDRKEGEERMEGWEYEKEGGKREEGPHLPVPKIRIVKCTLDDA